MNLFVAGHIRRLTKAPLTGSTRNCQQQQQEEEWCDDKANNIEDTHLDGPGAFAVTPGSGFETVQANAGVPVLLSAQAEVVVLAGRQSQEEEGTRASKRKIIIISFIVVLLIMVGAVVGIGVRLQKEKKGTNSASRGNTNKSSRPLAPWHDTFSSPCANSNMSNISDQARMTTRFMGLRSTVETILPDMVDDTPLSTSYRLALCWIADLDELVVDVYGDEVMQRFILTLIYFRLVTASLAHGEAPEAQYYSTTALANLNWLSSGEHECVWDNIECNPATKQVEILRFNNFGLEGPIPKELSFLSELKDISLISNDLTGRIPTELWSMTQLERLMLTSNQLNGTFPLGDGGNLSELTSFSIALNSFTGSIPSADDWANLPKLTALYASNNRFGGTFPDLSTATQLGECCS